MAEICVLPIVEENDAETSYHTYQKCESLLTKVTHDMFMKECRIGNAKSINKLLVDASTFRSRFFRNSAFVCAVMNYNIDAVEMLIRSCGVLVSKIMANDFVVTLLLSPLQKKPPSYKAFEMIYWFGQQYNIVVPLPTRDEGDDSFTKWVSFMQRQTAAWGLHKQMTRYAILKEEPQESLKDLAFREWEIAGKMDVNVYMPFVNVYMARVEREDYYQLYPRPPRVFYACQKCMDKHCYVKPRASYQWIKHHMQLHAINDC